LVVAASAFGRRGGETLSDNWILAGFGVGAAAAAPAGGAVALVAVIRGSRELLSRTDPTDTASFTGP